MLRLLLVFNLNMRMQNEYFAMLSCDWACVANLVIIIITCVRVFLRASESSKPF